MDVTGFLSNTGFIMYNKSLARLLGVHEAILIGELCAKYQYWHDRGELAQNGGWFYLTREDIEKDTGLTPKQQRPALQKMADNALLESKRMGAPSRIYYRLNIENLNDLICPKVTSRCAEMAHLDMPKGHDLICPKVTARCAEMAQLDVPKGHDINRYTKKETKKEKEKEKEKERFAPRIRFQKPTVEEIEAFCRQQGYQMDARVFFDYYESKGWVVGKAPMKDWRAAVRNWMRREKQAPEFARREYLV